MFVGQIKITTICFFFFSLFFSPMLRAQSENESLVRKAEEAFRAQRWKSAATLYNLLLQDSVGYTPVYSKALMANMLSADSVSLQRADAIFKDNQFQMNRLLRDFSDLCIREHQFDLFEETLLHMTLVMPQQADTLFYGMIQYRLFLRQPEKVIRLTNMRLEKEPRNKMWLSLQGYAYQMKGDSSGALLVYNRVLKLDPYNLDANLFIGNYYYLNGKKRLKEIDNQLGNGVSSEIQTQLQSQKQIVFSDYFSRAAERLEVANRINPNNTIANTLSDIYALESELFKTTRTRRGFRR